MNLDALKPAREALLAELARREREPFPTFVRAWLLTALPFIVMCALLAMWPHSILLWIATALVAGFVQNALGLLMHEGSHYFFHRSKKTGDVLSDVLVCLPIFNTVQGYRNSHFDHHRTPGEPSDPYWELYGDYPTRWHLVRRLLLDVIGVTAVKKFFGRYGQPSSEAVSASKKNPPYALPVFLVIQAVLWALLWRVTGQWWAWIVLWVAPLMTVPIVINRFRTLVEHYPGFLGIKVNRTSITRWFEYLCVAPYGYGHHLEHHLLPQVAYYDLAFAHRFLAARVDFADNEVNSHGYFHTFHRLWREMGQLEKHQRAA